MALADKIVKMFALRSIFLAKEVKLFSTPQKLSFICRLTKICFG